MAEKRYWFAYERGTQDWPPNRWRRWALPIDWRGSALTFGIVLAPIVILLALVPVLPTDLPDWMLIALLLALVGGSLLAGVLVIMSRTDPTLSIEDYRERKAALKQGRPGDSA